MVFSKPPAATYESNDHNSIPVDPTANIEFDNSLWFQQSYFLFDGGFYIFDFI